MSPSPHSNAARMAALTRSYALAACVVLFSLLCSGAARALETFATGVPNRIFALNSEGVRKPCVTCHNNPDGGTGCENTGGLKPCLNPFGQDFRHSTVAGTQDRTWTAALAAMDSDKDGFSNAQELQSLLKLWTILDDSPGNPDYVTGPGDPAKNPGTRDTDGDRHCIVGFDINMDGDCLDPQENNGLFDCNESDALAYSNREKELCDRNVDSDCDGLVGLDDSDCADVADQDGDGYCRIGFDANHDGDCLDPGEGQGGSDCDDKQVTVNSGAPENCFDGRDNDCDGKVDMADTNSCSGDRDNDGDGYCTVGRDLNADRDCRDAGENTATGDCDDNNAAVKPGGSELICRDGLDNDCDAAGDLADSDCASVADRDKDGHCPSGVDLNKDGDCLDENETDAAQADCDDTQPKRSRGLKEECADKIDNDCDNLIDTADNIDGKGDCKDYVDGDHDGYCVAGEDFFVPRNGLCTDPGETLGFNDCLEYNASASPIGKEACFDGVDNDCDGSADAFDSECRQYRDGDGDGFCLAGHDDNKDGDCADANEQGTPNESRCPKQGGVDPDARPTVYPGAFEHCRDNLDNDCNGAVDQNDTYCMSTADKDGDGYCPLGKDLSVPPDGDCADVDERTAQSDCNDSDPKVGPDATEDCKDHRDNNCNTKVDLQDDQCGYLFDRDGDGFCGRGKDESGDGDCLDSGEDTDAADCKDDNSKVFPGSREICDDMLDNDCDGRTDAADESCTCTGDSQCVIAESCAVGRCVSMSCQYEIRCSEDASVAVPDAAVMAPVEPTVMDGGVSDEEEMTKKKGGGSSCAVAGHEDGRFAPWCMLTALALVWRRRRRVS